MKNSPKLCFIFFCITHLLFANNTEDRLKQLEKQFDYDYAIQVIDSALNKTEISLGKNHPTYDQLLYEKAVIYEGFDRNKEALNLVQVLKSKDLSPYLSAKLNIELSLIYEKINFFPDCFEALNQAKQTIEQHQIEELKPFYYLRKASAHRVSNHHNLALECVDSALVFGHEFKDHERLAHIYLVKAFLENSYLVKPKLAIQSMENALKHAHATKDLKIELYANHYLLNWHLRINRTDSALIYARNSLSILDHHPKVTEAPGLYQKISQVYNMAQKTDSALYIRKKGELAEINLRRKSTEDEIATIVENFQKAVHQDEIQKHKKELDLQTFKVKQLYVVTGIFVVLSFLIFYLYLRTRKLLKRNITQQNEIKRINQDLKLALEQESFLTKELHHRVKNNLQIIIGLLDLQDQDAIPVKAISKQIFSISAGHELLYQEGIEGSISIKTYLQELVNYIQEASGSYSYTSIDIHSEDYQMDLETLIPIGLLMNELISNSIKHAKHLGSLNISIQVNIKDSILTCTYKDSGSGFEIKEEKFGSMVIQAMIQQLRGELTIHTQQGAFYRFTFPLPNSEEIE